MGKKVEKERHTHTHTICLTRALTHQTINAKSVGNFENGWRKRVRARLNRTCGERTLTTSICIFRCILLHIFDMSMWHEFFFFGLWIVSRSIFQSLNLSFFVCFVSMLLLLFFFFVVCLCVRFQFNLLSHLLTI